MISATDAARDEVLDGSPFAGYTYAYPHKTAYRRIPVRSLQDVWEDESVESLFLYLHIPFCEYRCGFCNLFTLAQPDGDLPGRYLESLRQHAEAVRQSLPRARFARLAIGGGTPTFLSAAELETLFEIVGGMGADSNAIPVSCEASPATLDEENLSLLRDFGVDRLSVGIQSFADSDVRSMGRPQRRAEVEQALEQIARFDFPTLNIDLMYGGEGQTMQSWLASVTTALEYQPQELYLYPLYVRQLTGLAKIDQRRDSTSESEQWDQWRLDAYRRARDLLLERGYEQVSLRMFRAPQAPSAEGPVYRCQEDGMIGLGCGARSYTRGLHYSCDYAVGSREVLGILRDYLQRDHEAFSRADYGFPLDEEDQRRRFTIISILQTDGLMRDDYRRRFGADVLQHLPELRRLLRREWAVASDERLRLTAAGLERSDAIGPWLYSEKVRRLMEQYAWR